jgi:cytochrome c oxidase cbb3-type subunit 3
MKMGLEVKRLTGIGVVAFFLASLGISACDRERPRMREAPPFNSTAPRAQQSELVPGPESPGRPPVDLRADDRALAEGKRLYNWYNCSGCHFAGGGGIGPPLMDDEWIYGSHPRNIADSIIEGRPNGMPAYGGRIPAEHVGPVVAYVRRLSGLGPGSGPTPTPLPQGGGEQGEAESDSRQRKEAGGR